ncbi:MAG TPA: heme exporter protein CcmD [Rhizomicrobium sp.]|nr:heme exporter protein CcmD [Rhizomicrobium sp.]
MADFWWMGGYAAYVWPAYGVTFVGLVAAILVILARYERTKIRLKRMVGEEEGL